MLAKVLHCLIGFDHYRHRGDRFFLENDFARALREYRRARSALISSTDYRAATVEALIRECSSRISGSVESGSRERDTDSDSGADASEPPPEYEGVPLLPGLGDLFELAISEKSPDRAGSYRGLGGGFEAGYVALVQGDAGRAVHYLDRSAQDRPASFALQLELGRALSLAGNMERAREELHKALDLSPADAEGQNLLAAVDIQLGRFEEAVGLLQPLRERSGAGPETTFLLGKCMAGLGKHEKALDFFRETVEMDSRFHEAYFEGARLRREAGDAEGALRLLARACAMLPDEVSYNREMAELVLGHHLDEEAGLVACDRLMVTDEQNRWQYLSWIAELYLRRGWRREARDPLHKALRLIPPDRTRERLAVERRLAELEGCGPTVEPEKTEGK